MNEDCLKLTSYFGERQRTADNGFAADALLDLYGRRGIATSILLRGAEGFGARQHLRTDRSESLSHDLPLTAVAVDTRSRIEGLLDPTVDLLRSGLVTLERARLLTGDLETVAPGGAPDEETKLTVYVGRQERVYRVPAFVAVCDLLHRRGIAGATALLGVDGTAHGERERAAFFSRNAGTPMMVIAVGSGTRIARVLPELGGLLRQPLLTLERVRICKRDGELLCRPPTAGESRPAADETRRRRRQLPAGAQAHGLHLGGRAPRRPADPPRDRPPAARRRDQRRDHAARHVGVPRRPPTARRPPAPARQARPRRHDRDRHARSASRPRSTSSRTSPRNRASSPARRSR